MKEKELEFNYVANLAAGGKSTMELYSGLDHEGLVASSFISEFKYLEEVSSEIEIKINSSGGSVMSGLNIVSTILDSKTPTTARVVGIAASMASVIALAADKTVITNYGAIMWHNPFSPSGEAEDDQIKAFSEMLKSIYSSRLGMNGDEVTAFMNGDEGKDGTWFTASEALEAGLVSEIEETDVQSSRLKDEMDEIKMDEVVNGVSAVDHICSIAAELIIEDKQSVSNVGVEDTAAAIENTPDKINNNNMSLEKISAFLNIKDATVEAIEARVKEISAEKSSLEKTVADTNAELVAANKSLSDKDVAIATVSAELETAKSEKEGVEAKVVELEAKVAEFEAKAKEAHAAKIEEMVNEAHIAGKISDDAKANWTALLEASFESASVALEGLKSTEAKKVKLSDKVSAESKEEVVAKVEESAKKFNLPTMDGLMAEIRNKNK